MKTFLKIFLVLISAIAVLALINIKKIKRLHHTIHLFDEDVIVQNFQNMEMTYTVDSLKSSTKPLILPENKYYQPSGTFKFGEKTFDIDKYLKDTRTEGLIIIHKDTIIFENYWNDLKKDEAHISWSMSKSFTSTLVGIMYEKGKFKLNEPITKYLPQFKGTGYDGVTIKNLLQMSAGVRFNEDYGDFNSDINRFGRAFATGSSLEEFCKSLVNESEQGVTNHYVSINTQMLGLLVKEVSGRSITDLTQEYIWEPLGMEYNGSWITDNTGMEVVLGGLNATLRDFAKLGFLYKYGGSANGNRIVSEDWVKASLDCSEPHLKPGNKNIPGSKNGYGYQWWIPSNNPQCYAMGGIYNQYVYVNPVNDIIIAKLSANHHYKTQGNITKSIHFALFDKIIDDIVTQKTLVD